MNKTTKDITLVALFPALMAATAGVSIPLGNMPAITLQTLFVYLAGLLLTPRKAALSMSIYVLLGVMGLPVFSGFRGGFGVLLGGSGGFIIGFIFMAWAVAFMKNRNFLNNHFWYTTVVLIVATTGLYMIGASYITFLTGANYWLVLGGFYLYLVGDITKILTAIYVHVRIRSHVTYEYS
ncbi:MAG: biotin transporter BioY [Halieaceae bacterium]|jgi:biotin transport system substrate-specific component|nr:biotin transporter BioY [Halieaceae bacterium]